MKQFEPLAQLRGAGVFRGGRWLVRNVDLAIRPGEIVTLIGPNGSGKSTTAKMALGLLEPDEGSAERKPGLRVAYMPQKLAIDWTMPLTVERFMQLTRRLAPSQVEAALARTSALHLRGAEIRHLSGGEFQRVNLARVIAAGAELMVLDEPVQGIDFSGEAAIYELIARVRDESGCAILLISHDLHVVMAATDRVICLNGHVCCQGTPQAVAGSAEYRHLFGGRALAVYHHDHDHSHLPDGRVVRENDEVGRSGRSADGGGADRA